uniref:Uncharacterized protein n=1 Tax=Anopheles melas TaxID=34690 RepID=A0A182UF56_9DIPT
MSIAHGPSHHPFDAPAPLPQPPPSMQRYDPVRPSQSSSCIPDSAPHPPAQSAGGGVPPWMRSGLALSSSSPALGPPFGNERAAYMAHAMHSHPSLEEAHGLYRAGQMHQMQSPTGYWQNYERHQALAHFWQHSRAMEQFHANQSLFRPWNYGRIISGRHLLEAPSATVTSAAAGAFASLPPPPTSHYVFPSPAQNASPHANGAVHGPVHSRPVPRQQEPEFAAPVTLPPAADYSVRRYQEPEAIVSPALPSHSRQEPE